MKNTLAVCFAAYVFVCKWGKRQDSSSTVSTHVDFIFNWWQGLKFDVIDNIVSYNSFPLIPDILKLLYPYCRE